jgi:hypothetical protein
MKYGEIMIESLKLMFPSARDEITLTNLDVYFLDHGYKSYLFNMPGSINRCFSRIEEKGILPPRVRTLDNADGKRSVSFIRFDLYALIDDFCELERVICEKADGEYCGAHPYRREGNVIALEIEEGAAYSVVYRPSVKRITDATDKDEEIAIPESICSLIPYYVKGDLYRDDEQNEASEARNWFEQETDEMLRRSYSDHVDRVSTVYSQVAI